MKLEYFLKLAIKTLANGQKLVEIEPNTWVDYETYKPVEPTETIA